jgi:hypothetical protein
MNTGKTQFAQVMDFLPWKTFQRIADRYEADRRVRTLLCRGAWEIEHSIPRACGGSDRMNNLYAACISCNRAKGARTTRSMRLRRGLTRAPMSANARTAAKRWNAFGGSLLGAIPGVILLGPPRCRTRRSSGRRAGSRSRSGQWLARVSAFSPIRVEFQRSNDAKFDRKQ